MSSRPRSGKLPPVRVEEPQDDLYAGAARGAGAGAWFLLGAAVVGLGISTYLTTLHYAGVAPICTTNGFINCGSVLKSSYSVVPGTSIPVTVPASPVPAIDPPKTASPKANTPPSAAASQ